MNYYFFLQLVCINFENEQLMIINQLTLIVYILNLYDNKFCQFDINGGSMKSFERLTRMMVVGLQPECWDMLSAAIGALGHFNGLSLAWNRA